MLQKPRPRRFAHCRVRPGDEATIPNLSVSPAEMMQMSENGIPVSSANAALFNDGSPNPSWDIPLDRTRGVDPADLWQARQSIRKKAKDGHLRDLAKYGPNPSE